MSKFNLRQHHGIVTGANTDNKAVSQNDIANGIGYKSEITSENLNAFFQRNDTSIDTLVSLIMETIRTDKTDIDLYAFTNAIRMHGQSTYYYDTSIMTNMQVGDRFSDCLGNVYQITAGKIIDGVVCDNAGHQIIFSGRPLPAKIVDIRNYIYSLPEHNDYRIGYNTFARKMTRSAFQVIKIVGNKRHTTWQHVDLHTNNAIEIVKSISETELLKTMLLPILNTYSRINVLNLIDPGYMVYQSPLSFQMEHNGSDINTANGYLDELVSSGHYITLKRNNHNQTINIKKISLINL